MEEILKATKLWAIQTMCLIGVLASITFVRVNFFGAELKLDFPEYAQNLPMKMNGHH